MEEPLKVGIYVLLLLPGFILVQTRDYHLQREKRSQFETTLDIVLWSAAIWMIAFASPVWWPSRFRSLALSEAWSALRSSAAGPGVDWRKLLTTDSAAFFGSVSLWAFLGATFWGLVRKSQYVDAIIQWATGSISGEMLISIAGRVAKAFIAESRGGYRGTWSIEDVAEQMDAIRNTDAPFIATGDAHVDHIRYSFEMAAKCRRSEMKSQ